jgi:PEP-CTERM/exosortase A-associated glycosyltransferase
MARVLHILDHSLPLHSGYTFRTRAILKGQQKLGIDVRAVTGHRHSAEGPTEESIEGLYFHRTPGVSAGPPLWREWREISALAETIDGVCEEWRPDVIHAHSPALCGSAAQRVAAARDIPFVYEIRAFWEDASVGNLTGREGSAKYYLTRALENRVVAAADRVVTICDGLRDDLVQRGFERDKIDIVPNGVDLALFGTAAKPDPELRRKLELGDGPVIAFIGSFYDYEGLDTLIDAMRWLLGAHPDVRLLLVGGGPRAAALEAQAEASPAAEAIRFVGRVPHADVPRYYALADIMAYPRKSSRLTDLVTPLKPLEAMAQDKIVAASSVGGHCELVEGGVTGALFEPDSPEACAEALARLLDHREDWPALRAAAKAHVREHHDWAKNAGRYEKIYHDLLARKAK